MNKWEQAFGKKVCYSLFTGEEVELIEKMVYSLAQKEDRKEYIWKYYEGDHTTLTRVEYFVKYHTPLRQLATSRRILDQVETLMGEPCTLFKDKINYKYPHSEEFVPHQDIASGWGRYSTKHITFALPLCNTTEENSALEFGPVLTEQKSPDFSDFELKAEYELTPTVVGDAVFFDSYVPHRSQRNKSASPSPCLFFTYTPSSEGDFYERYHSDKFNNNPPDIYKEEGNFYRSSNTNLPRIYQKDS